MSTKSKPAKVAKKEVVKKEPKVKKEKNVVKKEPKVKKEKNVVTQEAKVRFVSLTIGATIPTQSFGNMQPSITVEAPTYEEARDFAVSKIEELYQKYADVKPAFLGRVTATEKVVDVAPTGPTAPVAPAAPVAPTGPTGPAAPVTGSDRPAPFLKAERAIKLASSYEALDAIEEQIKNSVKINPADKPELLLMATNRRNELPF